jgi:magnesium transporter
VNHRTSAFTGPRLRSLVGVRVLRYEKGTDAPEPVDPGDLASAVDEAHALLWLDTDDPDDKEREHVVDALRVSPLVVEALTNPQPERTKLTRYGDYFHVAVHDCALRTDDLETSEIDIVIGPGWIITVRHRSDAPDGRPLDMQEVERRFDLMRSEHSTTEEGFLLWAVFDVIVDRYFEVNDVIDDRLDKVEDNVFSDTRNETISHGVFTLRRALVDFRRAAAPMREVLDAIARRDVPFVGGEAVVHFEELRDRLLRVLDFIETERDLLSGLLEADLTVISNNMNRVMKQVTSWAAILVSASLITGIYGMNFEHMPELKWQYGYPMALGAILLVTGTLYVVFRRKHWL